MDPYIQQILGSFTPISLEKLNSKAAMLERLDNKYIVTAKELGPALSEFAELFDVLEIKDQRAFGYATRYYDDVGLQSYYDHHRGRRKRSKVRIRDYLDAGFSYLEVKLKTKRNITLKKRLKLSENLLQLGTEEAAFIDDCHMDLYAEQFGRHIDPVIWMRYQRITLVAKEGGERMTIDTELQFEGNGIARQVRPDMFIVETKSKRGNGIADKILRNFHLHPTKRCSKYCVGMAATGQVARNNSFLPALRRLELVAAS